ncbi:hypothetical protein KSC_066650 [Ktedonobacter sp. SOSP1-52]|uniref:hypothetical protein n=1 Tax=Ktedonobacter sp. SOSP1-52 TaxID=2778366 RepID=UPI001916B6D7|nr:hypothetical protein [Ktedonobacter sp. SOSP1-52]GHO67773.1 hypothetical protein KSC_066650 [Ktedonobacter sp. SOSP1-52]
MENEYQRDQNLDGELGGGSQRDQNLEGELGGGSQRDLGTEQGTEKKGLFERAKEVFQKPSERHDQDVTQSDVPQRDEDLAGRSWQGDAGAYERDQGVTQRPLQGDVTQQQNINQEPLQSGIPQQGQDVSGVGQRDVYQRDRDVGQTPLTGGTQRDQDVNQSPLSGGMQRDQDVIQMPPAGGMQRDQDVTQTPGVQPGPDITSGSAQRDVYERDQNLNQGQGPLTGRDRDVTQNRDVSQAPWSGQQFDNQPEENYSAGKTPQTESGFDLIRERDDELRSAEPTGATGVTGNEPYTQRGDQGDITENRPPEAERHPNDWIDRAKDKLEGLFGNPDDPSPER